MDHIARTAFITAYTSVLSEAWSSDEFAERLEAAPQSVLAEHGLATVTGAAISIVRSRDAGPDLDAQVALWERGHATGEYVLYVPHTPQICVTELADIELDGVAAGSAGCCCCNPCCCEEG